MQSILWATGYPKGDATTIAHQVAVSELHNVFLRPFHAAVDAGGLSIMTGFNTVNGVPCSGHQGLLRGMLKEDWRFDGLVVSDWSSVVEMVAHGYAADERCAACLALQAGIDMEMATGTFRSYLKKLLAAGEIDICLLDDAVARVLRMKFRVALQQGGFQPEGSVPTPESLAVARDLAAKSVVLLKNEGAVLPLRAQSLKRVALIGPLIDAPRDQLGCWMLDGKTEETVTLARALRAELPESVELVSLPSLKSTLDGDTGDIPAAAAAAREADVIIICVGEGWELSGEARSRADLSLPGAQQALFDAVVKSGKPVVTIVMAGRPLTIGSLLEDSDALMYAWHPGTMGGPAIADLLVGKRNPSGKLPVTFPKHVGQVPLYYNHPNTGRPALAETRALLKSGLDDFPAEQKYRSHYLDVDPFPLLPFGYGMSYTQFQYGEPELSQLSISPGMTLGVRVTLSNTGSRAGEEVAQLYISDVSARLVRPVRELKKYRRVWLEPGESTVLEFAIATEDLAYFDNQGALVLEPGLFRLGVGGDSTAPLSATFELQESTDARQARP